ncbi:MAG: aminoacyl-tRNA hydrolase [bacterium]
MKLIVGLGNPGKQYDDTRHNVGFWAVDQLVEYLSLAPFSFNKKFEAEITRNDDPAHHWFFMKPQTFMNRSGEAVGEMVRFYRLALKDLLIIHDDLDLPPGELRPAQDRGTAGHNGVESIVAKLGTQDFYRLRIGIGSNRELGIPAEDYVLQKFTEEQQKQIEQTVQPIVDFLLKWTQ